jgi:hypothetical protein
LFCKDILRLVKKASRVEFGAQFIAELKFLLAYFCWLFRIDVNSTGQTCQRESKFNV